MSSERKPDPAGWNQIDRLVAGLNAERLRADDMQRRMTSAVDLCVSDLFLAADSQALAEAVIAALKPSW